MRKVTRMEAVQTAPRFTTLATDGHERLIEAHKAMLADAKQAKASLEVQLSALSADIAWREEQIKGLRNGVVPTREGNGGQTKERPRTRTPARSRRGGGQTVTEEAVFEAIKSGACDTSAKLAASFHAPTETILRRLRALEAKGSIVRAGSGRETRWVLPAPAGDVV